jgi:coniferyl-aldehyde dehydrogenase
MGSGGLADIEALETVSIKLAQQQKAFARNGTPSAAERRALLASLVRLLTENEVEIIDAVAADFGVRAHVETRLTDLLLIHAQIALTSRKLGRWMKPRRVPTPMYLWPGLSKVVPQPLGVVGIIGAWNYPVATLLAPMVCAIGAGNRVILKPSEQAPRTAETMARLLAQYFEPEMVTTILGGPEVAAEFANSQFDHIFFTGSGAIGRRVAVAAAENLVPVTLELGGKSPAIIDPGCKIETAINAIAFGKFLNAGQTCVGVDYIIAPKGLHEPVVTALQNRFNTMFPNFPVSTDYTHILTQRHFDRLQAILDDAIAKGARAIRLSTSSSANGRAFPPTVLLDVNDSMRVMNEEIFGPLLPIVACQTTDDAIAYVNARDKPLALYWFGRDRKACDMIIEKTFSGGVTINGTATHVFQRALPFGGVGPSGTGEYFGEAGFHRFSKQKSVFVHGPFSTMPLLAPPYTARTDRLLSIMRKIL